MLSVILHCSLIKLICLFKSWDVGEIYYCLKQLNFVDYIIIIAEYV